MDLKKVSESAVSKAKRVAAAAQVIRIATVAPLFAAALILILYFSKAHAYESVSHLLTALGFLSVFPLMSYPLSLLLPVKKGTRRDAQRSLAIVFAVLGYIGGVVFSFIAPCTLVERVVYLTYLLSGAVTALLSFVFHVKSSGHACGVAGPVTVLIFFVSPFYLFALLLIAAVYWSSLQLKRHTLRQLMIGSVVPVAAMAVSLIICR